MSPKERISQTMRAMGLDHMENNSIVKGVVWIFRFVFAIVVDSWDGLSLTRFLAVLFAYLVYFSVTALNGQITTNTLWLALAAASIAFGKSTFTFFLRRSAYKGQSNDVNVNIKTNAPLRDVDNAFQQTP